MIEFIPYRAEHMKALKLQAAQAEFQAMIADTEYASGLVGPHAWTVLVDGEVAAVGGVMQQGPNRGYAWSLISDRLTARHFGAAHRFTVRRLREAHASGLTRLETYVTQDFENGHRWAKALGFVCDTPEGTLYYSPQGNANLLYARVA